MFFFHQQRNKTETNKINAFYNYKKQNLFIYLMFIIDKMGNKKYMMKIQTNAYLFRYNKNLGWLAGDRVFYFI